MRSKYPSEYDEQCTYFEWAAKSGIQELRWLHATLNGVKLPVSLAVKAKKSGMKRGPFDIYLDVARHGYSGLRAEFKRKKYSGRPAGVMSAGQREWLDHYEANSFYTALWYGADEAIADTKKYLGK